MQDPVESIQYEDHLYRDESAPCTVRYLLREIKVLCGDMGPGTRVLDVGCGNGFLAGTFLSAGCIVVGVELSRTGVEIARSTYPHGRFEVLAADEAILATLREEPFDIVVSTEVV